MVNSKFDKQSHSNEKWEEMWNETFLKIKFQTCFIDYFKPKTNVVLK